MITPAHYLTLGLILLAIGLYGVLIRRNALLILISLEVVLAAINLILLTAGRMAGGELGEIVALFVILIAACEAALGLAITVLIFKGWGRITTSGMNTLKDP